MEFSESNPDVPKLLSKVACYGTIRKCNTLGICHEILSVFVMKYAHFISDHIIHAINFLWPSDAT